MIPTKENPKLSKIVWDFDRRRYIDRKCVTCPRMAKAVCSGWLQCKECDRQ